MQTSPALTFRPYRVSDYKPALDKRVCNANPTLPAVPQSQRVPTTHYSSRPRKAPPANVVRARGGAHLDCVASRSPSGAKPRRLRASPRCPLSLKPQTASASASARHHPNHQIQLAAPPVSIQILRAPARGLFRAKTRVRDPHQTNAARVRHWCRRDVQKKMRAGWCDCFALCAVQKVGQPMARMGFGPRGAVRWWYAGAGTRGALRAPRLFVIWWPSELSWTCQQVAVCVGE
ncbi:hypothetical protein C8Q70DRAFT_26978 [Cubamyces menziesii]|nr:hypothetical protein C8Q70DRAFT_26978 [Cubamyces menziesii]